MNLVSFVHASTCSFNLSWEFTYTYTLNFCKLHLYIYLKRVFLSNVSYTHLFSLYTLNKVFQILLRLELELELRSEMLYREETWNPQYVTQLNLKLDEIVTNVRACTLYSFEYNGNYFSGFWLENSGHSLTGFDVGPLQTLLVISLSPDSVISKHRLQFIIFALCWYFKLDYSRKFLKTKF